MSRPLSPVSGKPMTKRKLYSYVIYKGTSIGYYQEFYHCDKTHTRFTDTELDEGNLDRFTKAYEKAINLKPRQTNTV
jgi:hypothetical protein